MADYKLHKVTDTLWEIPKEGKMRVPARIYAFESMLPSIRKENALAQAANVAHLPGIVGYSLAMPDIHWGYGFPIGGVAALDVDEGIVSPGGVGYDINCGVRLLATTLTKNDVKPRIKLIVDKLFEYVPTGVGAEGKLKISEKEYDEVMIKGARWAVEKGFGSDIELEFIEEQGEMTGAGPDAVSKKARERGKSQLGTLGSGNHFLEVGVIEEVYDEKIAQAFGLSKNQVTVMIHCGSRGFGHQVCDDFIQTMLKASQKYRIELPDRQLCCAPVKSPEGSSYLKAMRCAVNFAFANRQVIKEWAGEAIRKALGISAKELGLRTVYEVAHNIAKIETHLVNGKPKELCVHRKGATRSFGAGSKEIPLRYRDVGQPVLIPGDMGRYSFVAVGTTKAVEETWGSTCHGAGREMSRKQAIKTAQGRNITKELEEKGIIVRGATKSALAEEISEAYKDVGEVVEVCHQAGLSLKVAKITPLGNIKG